MFENRLLRTTLGLRKRTVIENRNMWHIEEFHYCIAQRISRQSLNKEELHEYGMCHGWERREVGKSEGMSAPTPFAFILPPLEIVLVNISVRG